MCLQAQAVPAEQTAAELCDAVLGREHHDIPSNQTSVHKHNNFKKVALYADLLRSDMKATKWLQNDSILVISTLDH